ncbi:vesicular integral-membrane protein VIP36 isoform X2 [Malaya genurostris]|uniref:vesicular integral-membrane protein VIP36 isoform X2 n=1 Tax=Malaya genurostris TaxID=325434 RepID=UPI0026F3B730|nr:vesicular integral-membrane protein VIP36 isoform X2 [Malaya genurostris]
MFPNSENVLVRATGLLFLLVFAGENHCSAGNSEMADYMKREHSLIKPYQGSGMTIPYWDFIGSTFVTNSYIRLTPDLQSKSAAIWNQIPCTSINWEVHIAFKVHGKGKDLYGDGMAIWYAKDRLQTGPVFGSRDLFQGLAIILDTYSNHNGPHNHQHPYISAMVNNGTLSYDHDRDGTHTQLAGCEAKFRNVDYDTFVSIRYENDVLTVSTDLENKNTWKQCFQVNGVKLPTGYHFGVSATTGDLSDNHDLLSIKFFELESPALLAEDRSRIVPSAASFEAPREHKDDPKHSGTSNVKIFFFILLGMLIVVALVVIGIMFYQKHQENSRKRFY